MDSKAKVVILIVLILISLAFAGATFYLFQKEHTRNVELENKLQDLSSKQKIAELKLGEAQKSLSALETKLKDTSIQIESLNSQLQQEKAAKDEALAKMEQLRVDLNQQKELRSDIEKKLSKSQEDVRGIQTKLGKIEAEKATLESKVKELEAKSNVELGKIIVTPESGQQPASLGGEKLQKPAVVAESVPAAASAGSLEGKVLVLNKEYNFAVINLGNKDGVVVGDQFSVYHSNKYIGDLKVEKVQDIMAAAGFASDEVKNNVKEGDKVVKKNK